MLSSPTFSAYQYEIQFKRTAMHANADGLSRLPLPEHTDNTDMSPKTTSDFYISQIEALQITPLEIESANKKDKVLSQVYNLDLWVWFGGCSLSLFFHLEKLAANRYAKWDWPDHIVDSLKAYQQHWR